MDSEKPFKTIEVIDTRTGTLCKVACMSCIRGHRTTSCGNPACRSKVLWTIKRPGRPANTCTCPYGRTGRCRCVVAQSACPHKSKKGEKRTVDCRCDEQGRWCCVLRPEHWDALMLQQKPQVDFYANPEAMAAKQSLLSTPAFSVASPPTTASIPSTPRSREKEQIQQPLGAYQSPTFEVPRFGLMGVGLPMGNEGHKAEDVLLWNGETPLAPREYQPYSEFTLTNATAHTAANNIQSLPPPTASGMNGIQMRDADFQPVTTSFEQMTMMTHAPPPQQTERWMADYFNYQFPSAICQSCGMNGCTCKNCPATMQNIADGSWAQCCSKQHARAVAPGPSRINQLDQPALEAATDMNGVITSLGSDYGLDELKLGGDQPFPTDINEFATPGDGEMMDFTEFVVTEPEPPARGCCCGGQR